MCAQVLRCVQKTTTRMSAHMSYEEEDTCVLKCSDVCKRQQQECQHTSCSDVCDVCSHVCSWYFSFLFPCCFSFLFLCCFSFISLARKKPTSLKLWNTVCHMGRRIHVCHMRRRIHVCHMRRRIHVCHPLNGKAYIFEATAKPTLYTLQTCFIYPSNLLYAPLNLLCISSKPTLHTLQTHFTYPSNHP